MRARHARVRGADRRPAEGDRGARRMLPPTDERQREIDQLRRRVASIRTEIFANLTPWQRVQLARHPTRPNTLDYVKRLVHRVRRDPRRPPRSPTITPSSPGMARYHGAPVLVVGHQKGGTDTKQKFYRNFGYARPEGYRKAIRAMRLAEKFDRPVDRLRRHAGGLPRHRVGGAGRRRGHRVQPAGDGGARRPDHRQCRRAKAEAAARSASRSATAS